MYTSNVCNGFRKNEFVAIPFWGDSLITFCFSACKLQML